MDCMGAVGGIFCSKSALVYSIADSRDGVNERDRRRYSPDFALLEFTSLTHRVECVVVQQPPVLQRKLGILLIA